MWEGRHLWGLTPFREVHFGRQQSLDKSVDDPYVGDAALDAAVFRCAAD